MKWNCCENTAMDDPFDRERVTVFKVCYFHRSNGGFFEGERWEESFFSCYLNHFFKI